MASLITLRGPDTGRHYPVEGGAVVIGRQPDSAVWLESTAVSRQHAQLLHLDDGYFIEDLGSSNGTFLNGRRIQERTSLTEGDTLQIGPYLFALRPDPPTPPPNGSEERQIIREQVNALPTNQTLYSQNAAHKLQVVLEIAQHLALTLDQTTLLNKLLDHLLRLFPHAERGIVLLCENDRLFVRGQRSRETTDTTSYSYSRTIVKRALDDGVGILSEDVQGDERF